jgi:DNA-binding CsgD family transcriptional regulator
VQSDSETLVAVAETAWRAGDAETARAALDQVEGWVPRQSPEWSRAQALRANIELRAGVPADAVGVLIPAVRITVSTDPPMALRMLIMAREAAFNSPPQGALAEVSALVASLPPLRDPGHEALRRSLLVYSDPAVIKTAGAGTAADARSFRRGRIQSQRAAATVTTELASALDLDDPELLMVAGGMAYGVHRHGLARQFWQRAVTLARARRESGTLATALEFLVPDEIDRGQYASAQAHAEEGRALAERTGRRNTACSHLSILAALAALHGDEGAAREQADTVLAEALPRRLMRPAGTVQHALGLMALVAGRLDEALTAFDAMLGETAQPGSPELALISAPDYVEAAVRAGCPDRVTELAQAYQAHAEAAGNDETAALAARCRALLSPPERAEAEFREALRLHARADRPFDHARTELLIGEFLRRHRQRAAARAHLHSAEWVFACLALPVWAARAGKELRATGEKSRPRGPEASGSRGAADLLTPQELQIARAVGRGATNREVAAQLFLSPRTVDYHLRKVYSKLGINSRRELVRHPSIAHRQGVSSQR